MTGDLTAAQSRTSDRFATPLDVALSDLEEVSAAAEHARAQAVARVREVLVESLTAALQGSGVVKPGDDHTLRALYDLADCRDFVDEAIAQFTDLAIDGDGASVKQVAKALNVSRNTVMRHRAKRQAPAE